MFPHYQSCFSLGNARAGNIRSSGGRSSPPPDPTFPRGAQPRCQTPQAFPCAHPSVLPGSSPTLCPAQAWAPLFPPPPNPRAKRELKQSPPRLFLSSHRWELCQHLQRSSIPFFLGQLQHLAVHGSLRERSQTRLLPPGAPVGMEKTPLGRQRAELHFSTSSPGFASAPHQQNPPPEFWHSGKNAAESTKKKPAQRGTAPKNQPHPSTPST